MNIYTLLLVYLLGTQYYISQTSSQWPEHNEFYNEIANQKVDSDADTTETRMFACNPQSWD